MTDLAIWHADSSLHYLGQVQRSSWFTVTGQKMLLKWSVHLW